MLFDSGSGLKCCGLSLPDSSRIVSLEGRISPEFDAGEWKMTDEKERKGARQS